MQSIRIRARYDRYKTFDLLSNGVVQLISLKVNLEMYGVLGRYLSDLRRGCHGSEECLKIKRQKNKIDG
jgi:hypothetical protein